MQFRALVLTVAAFAGSASASVIGISSPLDVTWLGSAPASVVPGALTGPLPFIFDEQQNVPVTNLSVNVINNPSTTPGTSFPGLLTATVDSHLFHLDAPFFMGSGSIQFSGQILGVIYRDLDLDATDVLLGAGGTTYPTTLANRGWVISPFGGFSINNDTFHFQFATTAGAIDIDQIRILTRSVPTPGAASLLALGGLTACRRRRRA